MQDLNTGAPGNGDGAHAGNDATTNGDLARLLALSPNDPRRKLAALIQERGEEPPEPERPRATLSQGNPRTDVWSGLGEDAWPAPPDPSYKFGWLAKYLDAVLPLTEADEVAIAVSLLIGFGNCVGRGVYFDIEDTRHFLNEFAVIVAETGRGRKGTSEGRVRTLLAKVDPHWESERTGSGIITPQGLLRSLRDASEDDPDDDRGRDVGFVGKRFLSVESEFASVLKYCSIPKNPLSEMIRYLWDGKKIENRSVQSPFTCREPHVSLIGHITFADCSAHVTNLDMANGFANRMLWICARRSQYLPLGGVPYTPDSDLVAGLRTNLDVARKLGAIRLSSEAKASWLDRHKDVTRPLPGLQGMLLGRADAHVRRLAAIFTLFEPAATLAEGVVTGRAMAAALALWDFNRRCVQHTFPASLGDRLADRILEAIERAEGKGLTTTELGEKFPRKLASELRPHVDQLIRWGYVVAVTQVTKGRPKITLFAPGEVPPENVGEKGGKRGVEDFSPPFPLQNPGTPHFCQSEFIHSGLTSNSDGASIDVSRRMNGHDQAECTPGCTVPQRSTATNGHADA